jgi:hypothetical protein
MINETVTTISLSDLKKQHKHLFDRALAESSSLIDNGAEMADFIAEVDCFLEELRQLSGEAETVEDYEWISDAALKWQLIFSSVLNVPHSAVMLSAPSLLKSPEPLKFYTDEELYKWCEGTALQQSLVRRTNFLLKGDSPLVKLLDSTPEQRDRDWQDAEMLFAIKVLEGGFHLARQLGPDSYHRLEQQWLSEVKRAKAFFLWEDRMDKLAQPSRHEQDYLEACRQLRVQLIRKDLKARPQEFEEVKGYLVSRYLAEGALDAKEPEVDKKYRFAPEKDDALDLVRKKAFRIGQATGGIDPAKDWEDALAYCRAFYDNIIPAVIEEDPVHRKEHSLLALRAFDLSQGQEYRNQIINCFEVALAIYFLDADIVESLWASHELPWESTL